ncbi:hypothetical protein BC832DRAFT_555845 [Gaertneriomyces semiglobifer]|nr:hypothetical protein BC832DRAFT_555845 [Gaertneriomyces semiglobifer]
MYDREMLCFFKLGGKPFWISMRQPVSFYSACFAFLWMLLSLRVGNPPCMHPWI